MRVEALNEVRVELFLAKSGNGYKWIRSVELLSNVFKRFWGAAASWQSFY